MTDKLLPPVTLVLFSTKYTLPNETDISTEQFISWGEMLQFIEEEYDLAIVEPVYMMEHSSVALDINAHTFKSIDPQGYDWGQIGFALITKEDALKAYQWDAVTKIRKEQLLKVISDAVVNLVDTLEEEEW